MTLGSARATALGLVLAVGVAAAGPSAEAAGPSFDCGGARQPVEKAICRSAALSALDRAMADAYTQALKRLSPDPEAQTALKKDQRLFVATRNQAFGHPDYDLEAAMTRQVALLTGINVEERRSLLHAWSNGLGTIAVAKGEGGRLAVTATGDNGGIGRGVCEFVGSGVPQGDTLAVAEEAGSSDYEGWTLRLTRRGRVITVAEVPPSGPTGAAGPKPFCGVGGSLAGVYFGVSDEGHGDEAD